MSGIAKRGSRVRLLCLSSAVLASLYALPAMAAVRSVADRLEKVVPDDFWPLPSYRDMLFVK